MRNSKEIKPLYNIKEAAEFLGVNEESVRRWCRSNRLKYTTVPGKGGTGKQYRFREEDLLTDISSAKFIESSPKNEIIKHHGQRFLNSQHSKNFFVFYTNITGMFGPNPLSYVLAIPEIFLICSKYMREVDGAFVSFDYKAFISQEKFDSGYQILIDLATDIILNRQIGVFNISKALSHLEENLFIAMLELIKFGREYSESITKNGYLGYTEEQLQKTYLNDFVN